MAVVSVDSDWRRISDHRVDHHGDLVGGVDRS